jgi:hypothetical protein
MDIQITGVLNIATQPNIISVGVLNSLNVEGASTFSSIYSSDISTFSSLNCSNIIQHDSIKIGIEAGFCNQNLNSIAIGNNAGYISQGQNSIAIGTNAGKTNQGSNSIAIGSNAGLNQAPNSIILNATGNLITGNTERSTYLAPLRNISQTNVLGYNSNTYELSYFSNPVSSSTAILSRIQTVSQSIPTNTNTSILFDTLPEYGNQGSTGISYNSTTGDFINLSGSVNVFLITAGVIWSTNTTGLRALFLGYGSIYQDAYCRTNILPTSINTAQQIVIALLMQPNEFFAIRAYQNSGTNLTFVNGTLAGCGITITKIS